MKKIIAVVAVVLLVVIIFGVVDHMEKDRHRMAEIHELSHILTYAEQKGTDYAADRMEHLLLYRYTRDELREKWGKPIENTEDSVDVWQLSGKYRLIVQYQANDEAERITVEQIGY